MEINTWWLKYWPHIHNSDIIEGALRRQNGIFKNSFNLEDSCTLNEYDTLKKLINKKGKKK